MGLIGNYSVLNKSPGRFFSGGTISDTRQNWCKPGSVRAFVNNTERNISAIPNGCTPPVSWIISQKSGGIASKTGVTGSGATNINISGGKNASSSITGSGDVTQANILYVIVAAATLIASGSASAEIFGTLVAEADLQASGDIVSDLAAAISANASINGAGELASSMAGALQAPANLNGTTTLSANVAGKLEALANLVGSSEASADPSAIWNMAADLSADAELQAAIKALGCQLASISASGSLAANPQAKAFISAAVAITEGTLTAGEIVQALKPDLTVINEGVKNASILVPHSDNLT